MGCPRVGGGGYPLRARLYTLAKSSVIGGDGRVCSLMEGIVFDEVVV